jgi:hypothetical protein
MAKRGRPRSERAANARIVRVTLRLYPGEDDDLIGFFGDVATGLRATSVKRALREGRVVGQEDVASEDPLLIALDRLVD